MPGRHEQPPGTRLLEHDPLALRARAAASYPERADGRGEHGRPQRDEQRGVIAVEQGAG
ncbi:hypothetical protein [Streptomyces rectiverticillatus]|uniref:hypothetical protein n=1 Tax=Streptomyces rectiverticillatus TaxID=173860 RepID=UPI0015C2C721